MHCTIVQWNGKRQQLKIVSDSSLHNMDFWIVSNHTLYCVSDPHANNKHWAWTWGTTALVHFSSCVGATLCPDWEMMERPVILWVLKQWEHRPLEGFVKKTIYYLPDGLGTVVCHALAVESCLASVMPYYCTKYIHTHTSMWNVNWFTPVPLYVQRSVGEFSRPSDLLAKHYIMQSLCALKEQMNKIYDVLFLI